MKNADNVKWTKAQEHELSCWSGITAKLKDENYMKIKSEYWEKTLEEVDFAGFMPDKEVHILDVGCGPSGILINIAKRENAGKFIMTGIDPLMDKYIELNPSLKSLPVNWIHGKFEDHRSDRKYDIIFCMNAADHCDDLSVFMEKLSGNLKEDGVCCFSVNCHIKDNTARIWRKHNNILDPMHPYQYTVKEYGEMLSKYFRVSDTRNCSHLVKWIGEKSPAVVKRGIRNSLRKLHPVTIYKNMIGNRADKNASNPDGIFAYTIFILRKP